MKTRELLLNDTRALVAEHSCPYAEQLLEAERHRQIGSSGINLAILSSLSNELNKIHAGGDCPPTHVGTGPTTEWAEWVKDTQI